MSKAATNYRAKERKLIPVEIQFDLDTTNLDEDALEQLRARTFTGELSRILEQIIHSVTSTPPDGTTTAKGPFLKESGPSFVEDIGPWPEVIWSQWLKYKSVERLVHRYNVRRPAEDDTIVVEKK